MERTIPIDVYMAIQGCSASTWSRREDLEAKIINFIQKIMWFLKFITIFASNSILSPMENDLNRLKVVLAEKKRTNKWLAQQLGKDPATVSKWCTNTAQPGLETLREIANLLDIDIKDLLNSTKDDNYVIYRK